MKKCLLFTGALFFVSAVTVNAQNTGEELFKATCIACHTIGKGKLIGPDLSGVYTRVKTDWMISFVKSSQKMVKAGDPDAVAIFNQFNKIPMPDNNLTDAQVINIINYIKAADQALVAAATPSAPLSISGDTSKKQKITAVNPAAVTNNDTTTINYTAAAVVAGDSLFKGYIRFKKGASPCVGCHNINDESILGGGKLGLDLTGSYAKLGPAGIKAILATPPFPVMQGAFLNHNLQPDEINALLSYFRSISENPAAYQTKKSAGLFFFAASFICAAFIIAIIYVLYDNRKIPYIKI